MAKDFELVKRVLDGNREAFREIIADYQRLVNHIVYRMIRDTEDREDICQDIFIKVYQNLDKFRGESKLSTWIGRIAANRCIDWMQARRLPLDNAPLEESRMLEDEKADDPSEQAERQSLSEVLRDEIENLRHPYRTVLTLYHLDEMSYNEIGRILGMPEGTVKSYLYRARRKLKDRLSSRYIKEELWQ